MDFIQEYVTRYHGHLELDFDRLCFPLWKFSSLEIFLSCTMRCYGLILRVTGGEKKPYINMTLNGLRSFTIQRNWDYFHKVVPFQTMRGFPPENIGAVSFGLGFLDLITSFRALSSIEIMTNSDVTLEVICIGHNFKPANIEILLTSEAYDECIVCYNESKEFRLFTNCKHSICIDCNNSFQKYDIVECPMCRTLI